RNHCWCRFSGERHQYPLHRHQRRATQGPVSIIMEESAGSMSALLQLLTLLLLLMAAWRDTATRTIPDVVSLSLVTLGMFGRAFDGPFAFAVSTGIGLLLFITLLLLHSRGLIGGADVKLIPAVAIRMSPFDTYRFIIATALAGGLLA